MFYNHPSYRDTAIPHVESEIAEHLTRRGHHIVAYCPVEREVELPPWRGVELVGVPCRTIRGPPWWIGVEMPLRVALRLDGSLDVLILNGEPGAWLAFLSGRRHGAVGIFVVHGLIYRALEHRRAPTVRLRLRDRLLRRCAQLGERFSARIADLCIAGSRRLAPEIAEGLGVRAERIASVPNGVAPREPRGAEERQDARRRLGLPEGVFYAVFVGGEYLRKGLDVARAAVRRAQALGVPVVLLTVGNFSPPIESEVGYGWVDEATKWRILTAGDAFLFPTRYEAYSLAVREAAAVGLPLITTPQAGVDEGVNGRDYILCEPTDVEGFAQALGRLYRDPTWAAALAARGHDVVASWTFEKQAIGWETEILRVRRERDNRSHRVGPPRPSSKGARSSGDRN